jgi:hypothetical protein
VLSYAAEVWRIKGRNLYGVELIKPCAMPRRDAEKGSIASVANQLLADWVKAVLRVGKGPAPPRPTEQSPLTGGELIQLTLPPHLEIALRLRADPKTLHAVIES